MNPYEAIANLLHTEGLAVKGVDLFIGHIPPEPDTCVTIVPTPDIYESRNIAMPYTKGTFMLHGRGLTFTAVYDTMTAMFSKIHNIGGIELSGIRFVEVRGLQYTPHMLEKDALNRIVLAQNYLFEVYDPTENRYFA